MPIEGFKIEPTLLLLAILTLSLLVGLRSRARKSGYSLLAGRSIGPMGIGAAIASNWMSAASFLGIAGVFYLQGYMAFAYVVGWTGGYVLLLILMATQIRRFGKYTAAEFVEARYDSAVARCLAAVITILISLIYCVAQYKGIALVFSWMFGLDYSQSLFLGTTVVLGYLILSGSLGAIRNQPFLCAIVLLAFIVPLMCLSKKLGFDGLFPQTEYGRALANLTPVSGNAPLAPWIHCTPYEWIALCFTLMVGTVGLPHVLSRFYTVPNLRDARWSVVWGLFFIGLLYWSAPAYATFAEIARELKGLGTDPGSARQLADLVVIKAGEWSGLSLWLTGTVAAGAIVAAFSTVTGMLITGAGAFAYDIYHRLINPNATEQRQIAVAKGTTLVLAIAVVLLAVNPPWLIAQITAVAFALAGNTLFPIFLLGIWWDRTNKYGAIAGMGTGLVITFGALLGGTRFPLLGTLLPATSSALLGAPLVIVVMILVSRATPPPPVAIRRFLAEEVHEL